MKDEFYVERCEIMIRWYNKNKEKNGHDIIFEKEIPVENREFLYSLRHKQMNHRDFLILLDMIGVCDINYALKNIRKHMNNPVGFMPDEEPEDKKGLFDRLFG